MYSCVYTPYREKKQLFLDKKQNKAERKDNKAIIGNLNFYQAILSVKRKYILFSQRFSNFRGHVTKVVANLAS